MSHTFVDVQGLAGAFSLGAVQEGFDMVARRSLPGGFGDDSVEVNRQLLGNTNWEQQTGQWETWEPVEAAFACGTPPCSGFSLLNTSKGQNARGADAAINDCMKALVSYAGRCKGSDGLQGPQIVSFESVQGAFSQGRDLMKVLRTMMEEDTGNQYTLTHVKMSGSAVGSAQMRHRYYFVIHRIPFGINTPEEKRVVTYGDAIGDLVGAPEFTWGSQEYPTVNEPTDWALDKRDSPTLNSHIHPTTGKFVDLVNELEPYWFAGEDINKAVKRLGYKPDAVRANRYNEDGTVRGWTWPRRIDPEKPGYVITGGGVLSFVHWAEPRFLTIREISRLMGYPDSWAWNFVSTPMRASMLIGKCSPVQSNRFIAKAVHDALDGDPQTGDSNTISIGDREYLHNSTNVYKPWLKNQLAAREDVLYA